MAKLKKLPENPFENKALAPHQVHQHVMEHIQTGAHDDFSSMLEHPNIGTDSLNALAAHYKDRMDEEPRAYGSILAHPKASKEHAEKFIAEHGHKADYKHGHILSDIARDRKDIHHSVFEGALDRQIAESQEGTNASSEAGAKASPDWIVNRVRDSQQREPEHGEMTSRQKETNRKIDNGNTFIRGYLHHATDHTPESTQKIVSALAGKPPKGMEPWEHSDAMAAYTKNNPHLTHAQLEEIYSGDKSGEAAKAALSHPNIDPAFLSRLALMPEAHRDAKKVGFASQLRPTAITSPYLPAETRAKVIQNVDPKTDYGRHAISALLEDPNLSEDEIRTLGSKGITSALKHPNAPHDAIEQKWAGNPKDDTASARDFLSMRNLPPSVLRELVNHKNTSVATDALNHPNVDESVVQAAMDRKSKVVNAAAARHPKAPKSATYEKLQSGHISGHAHLFDENSRGPAASAGASDPKAVGIISQRYAGSSPEAIKTTEGKGADATERFYAVKSHLATSPHVPAAEREAHMSDIGAFAAQHTDGETNHWSLPDSVKQSLKTLKTGVEEGSPAARQWALKNKMGDSLVDATSDKLDGDFLDKFAHSVETGVYGDRDNGDLKKVLLNPNVAQHTFDRIAFAKNFTDRPENYDVSGSGDGNATLYDERISRMPEAEREGAARQIFGRLAQEGQYAPIVASAHASPKEWDAAWSQMTPDDQEKFARRDGAFSEASKNDPARQMKAVMGHLGDEQSQSALAHDVISHLDPQKPYSWSLLKGAVARSSNNDDQHALTPDVLVSAMESSGLLDEDHADKMFQTLQSANASPAVYSQVMTKTMSNYGFKHKTDGQRASQFQDMLNRVPQDLRSRSVNMLLTDDPESLERMAPSIRGSGILNFLQTDTTPEGREAFKTASAMGLTNEIDPSMQDPEAIKSLLSSDIPKKSKYNIFRNVAANATMSPEQAVALSSRSAGYKLTGEAPAENRYSRGSRQSAEVRQRRVETAIQSVSNIVNALARHPEAHESQFALQELGRSIASDLNSSGPTSHLTKGDMQSVAGHYESAILGSPMDSISKFNALAPLDSQHLNGLYKQIKSTGDIRGASYVVNKLGDDAPQAMRDVIAAVAKNPAKLSQEQLFDTVGSMKYLKPNAEFAQSIVKSAEKRLATEPPPAGVDPVQWDAQARTQIANGLGDAALSSDDTDFVNYAADKLLSYAQHPGAGAAAQDKLVTIMNRSSMAETVGQKIWDSLPADSAHAEAKYLKDPNFALGQAMAKSENLESATHGWKLRAMMNSYAKLDPGAKSVLNRRVLKKGIGPEDKHYVAKAIGHYQTNKDDAVGLARAVNPGDVADIMDQALEDASDPLSTAVHHLADAAISQISSYPQDMGDVNYWSAMSKFARAVSGYPNSVTVQDGQDKQAAMSQLAKTLTQSIDHHLSAKLSADEPAHQDLVQGASDALKSLLTGNVRSYDHETSGQILSAIGKFGDSISPEAHASHYDRFVQRCSLKDDQWADAYKNHGPFYAAVCHAERLPAAAITNFPDEHMDSAAFDGAIGVADPRRAGEYMKPVVGKLIQKAQSMRDNQDGDPQHITDALNRLIDMAPMAFNPEQIKYAASHDHDFMRTAILAGAGGKEFFDHALESGQIELHHLASSPHADRRLLDHPNADHAVFDTLAKNPYAPAGVVNEAIRNLGHDRPSDLDPVILKNPRIDKDSFGHALEEQVGALDLSDETDLASVMHSQLPLIQNPEHGLQAMLSLPICYDVHPDMQNTVQSDKLPRMSRHAPLEAKVDPAVRAMGPDGQNWAEFKKANPKLENVPEIKQLFMSKQSGSGKVTPEELMAVASRAKATSFPLSYGYWDGAQRHSDAPNLVLQTNTHDELRAELSKNPKLAKFFALIQKTGNASSHPTTPHTIGWSRVDTSGGQKGWVIEEFQSDFSSQLRRDVEYSLGTIKNALEKEGVHVTPEEVMEMTSKIEKSINGWHEAAMKGVEDAARKHGVKELFMHGPDVRADMSGMSEDRELPVKLVDMYQKSPPKFGFTECDYTDYPNWSDQTKESVERNQTRRSTKCWRKKLA